jgi:hydrogenase maturation protease
MGVVILGLGNPVLTDDAVGLKVVEEIERLLADKPLPGVEVLASTRAGFELIDLLQGFSHAIIVDAIQVQDPQPGRVHKLGLENVKGNTRLNSIHEITLVDAFELAEKLGISMPESVQIYAIEAGDVYTLSETMSAELEKVVVPVAREIIESAKAMVAGLGNDECVEDKGEERKYRRAFYTPKDE